MFNFLLLATPDAIPACRFFSTMASILLFIYFFFDFFFHFDSRFFNFVQFLKLGFGVGVGSNINIGVNINQIIYINFF